MINIFNKNKYLNILFLILFFNFAIELLSNTSEEGDNKDDKSLDIIQLNIDSNNNVSAHNEKFSKYHATKNLILMSKLIFENKDITKQELEKIINDNNLSIEFFNDCKLFISDLRIKNIVENNLRYYINNLKKYINNKHIMLTIEYVTEDVIKDLIDLYSNNNNLRNYNISAEKLKNIFLDKINSKFSNFTKDDLIKNFSEFKDINFSINEETGQIVDSNQDNVDLAKKKILEQDLSIKEIKKFFKYYKNKSNLEIVMPLICIEDIKGDLNEVINLTMFMPFFNFIGMIVKFKDRWISCLIDSYLNKIRFFVADEFNENLIKNNDFYNFLSIINDRFNLSNIVNLNKPTNKDNIENKDKIINFVFTNNSDLEKVNKEVANDYRSPYWDKDIADLPELSLFFQNNIIPNKIKIIIDNLKSYKNNDFKLNSKKGLILYGPPGTGKSTIAELIARLANREVLFMDGGSFKTEYQGSGAKAVQELFAKARSMQKPVVIIIDELDGAANKLIKNPNTNEDNQTIKKIIAELNKNILSNDNKVYVICTTNYIENIEGPVLSRFDTLEVDFPDYQLRYKIILNYLKCNNIITEDSKLESNYEVSNKFIEAFARITDGLTGRDIQYIINDSVNEYKLGLSPEINDSTWKFLFKSRYNFKKEEFKSSLKLLLIGLYFIDSYLNSINSTPLEKLIYCKYLQEQKKLQKIKENNIKKAQEDIISKNTFDVKTVIMNTALAGVTTYCLNIILYKLSNFVIKKNRLNFQDYSFMPD